MFNKWLKGNKVKVNKHYKVWAFTGITKRIDGVMRQAPQEGQIGIILDIDEQGDAWVDFGDGEPDGWIMNPGWADVVQLVDTLWTDDWAYQRNKADNPKFHCPICEAEMRLSSIGTWPVHPRPSTHSLHCPNGHTIFQYVTRENTPENDSFIISDELWLEWDFK